MRLSGKMRNEDFMYFLLGWWHWRHDGYKRSRQWGSRETRPDVWPEEEPDPEDGHPPPHPAPQVCEIFFTQFGLNIFCSTARGSSRSVSPWRTWWPATSTPSTPPSPGRTWRSSCPRSGRVRWPSWTRARILGDLVNSNSDDHKYVSLDEITYLTMMFKVQKWNVCHI